MNSTKKPTGQKPIDQKPSKQKPTDQKPIDQKPLDAEKPKRERRQTSPTSIDDEKNSSNDKDCKKRGYGDGKNQFFDDRKPSKSILSNIDKVIIIIISEGPKKSKKEMYDEMTEKLKSDSTNFTNCLEEMQKADDKEWEIVDKWAG